MDCKTKMQRVQLAGTCTLLSALQVLLRQLWPHWSSKTVQHDGHASRHPVQCPYFSSAKGMHLLEQLLKRCRVSGQEVQRKTAGQAHSVWEMRWHSAQAFQSTALKRCRQTIPTPESICCCLMSAANMTHFGFPQIRNGISTSQK